MPIARDGLAANLSQNGAMMTITAKIIADSISDGCPRITTMQLRYHRFIHPEVMAHRAFSRNAGSSRAKPVARLIQDVIDDPAIPIHWGSEQKGMQAGDELQSGEWYWLNARNYAVDYAKMMAEQGYHKQIVNRLLEPFSHIDVLVTSTEWNNFFELRDHKDAQPEIQALAKAMRIAMEGSTPTDVGDRGWHSPYSSNLKISVACCASVSYKTVDGSDMTSDRANRIFDKLMTKPFHASPFEHQAMACMGRNSGNFTGWVQYRELCN